MKNDLVTVVVPVYNVEKYIEKCLEAIINQTYNNIEIIIVNDGSEDKSLDICKKIKLKDNRVKIINQENSGLSAARNTGIKNATGKYICFIDSDDYIHKDYIKLLLENLMKNNADISVCNFLYVDEDGDTWGEKISQNKTYSNIDAIKDLLKENSDTEVMTWNKLYKLSLFKDNDIYFPVGKLHEDNFTTYKLYYYSNSISLIENHLYYYMQREDSIMGKRFNIRRTDILEAIEEMKDFFKCKNIDLEEELNFYEAIIKIYILNNMIVANFCSEDINKIIDSLKKKRKKYIKNKYVNIKLKILLIILILRRDLYIKRIIYKNKVRSKKVH